MFFSGVVRLLQLVHICLGDYVHVQGGGREGLLWQHEVNQHSVHVAFHYKLCQTAEEYGSAKKKKNHNNRQMGPERMAMRSLQSAAVWTNTAQVATGGIILHISWCSGIKHELFLRSS